MGGGPSAKGSARRSAAASVNVGDIPIVEDNTIDTWPLVSKTMVAAMRWVAFSLSLNAGPKARKCD